MRLELATGQDFESIMAFYDDVIENTPEIELYARWMKGKHPTSDGIMSYIDNGNMYLYKDNG